MPTHDRQTPQRPVSTSWWQRIHGAIRMLCLLLIGVVAIGVTANAATERQPGSEAVAMEQIVAAGDAVFALAADHQAVYKWSAEQDNWEWVKDGAQKLYPGGDTVYAIEPGRGDISKYNPKTGQWPVIGGPGATFAATSKHLYGVSPDHNLVMEYTGKDDIWRKVGNRAQDLYAGPQGTLYVTNPDDKNIVKYDGEWNVVGGPGATFAVTDKSLFGLTPDHRTVVQYDPDTNKWNRIGGAAGTIFASNTLYATNPDTGDLYKYNGRPDAWNRVSGRAQAFATSGHYIYRLAPDRRSVQKYDGDGSNDAWRDLGAPTPPASREEKVARLDSLTQLGPEATADWTRTLDAHHNVVPDRYEFRWTTNECNFPARKTVDGYDFTAACIRHDFGYRNYRDLHGEKEFRSNPNGKARVDEILLQDANNVCIEQGRQPTLRTPFDFTACKAAAQTFYYGVKYGEPVVNTITNPGDLLPSPEEVVKGLLKWPGMGR
ncbi:phospholipase A2 [Streptomyces sp. NPDC086989]|uniref:phospholipase A2 n=1 Tax=Streptomyces sp. NPDC086989 TaxID=3365764 RepID=UPI00382DAC7C